ncbi:hypothetical protein ACFV3E_45590 [Streptomyces sp. NPDC059718]
MSDPESFFTILGDDVAREVQALWAADRLDEPTVPGESYLERVARLQQMRHNAESIALREMVLLPPEGDPDLADDSALTSDALAEEQWRDQHLMDLVRGETAGPVTSPRAREQARGRQRTDSTHVLAAVRNLGRLELVRRACGPRWKNLPRPTNGGCCRYSNPSGASVTGAVSRSERSRAANRRSPRWARPSAWTV